MIYFKFFGKHLSSKWSAWFFLGRRLNKNLFLGINQFSQLVSTKLQEHNTNGVQRWKKEFMKSLKGSNTERVESFLMETQKEAKEAFTRAKIPSKESTAGGQHLYYMAKVRNHYTNEYRKKPVAWNGLTDVKMCIAKNVIVK